MFTPAPSALVLAWRALLSALLVAACVSDVRTRRIPNTLVLMVVGAAFVHAVAVTVGGNPPIRGFTATPASAALGALCGLALWLPLYAVGAFGAGDVKLFAAAAAWIGPAAVPGATLYTAVAGGVLGLAWFGARRITEIAPSLTPRLLQPQTIGGMSRVPYGVAIAAGVLGIVWNTP